MLEGDTPYDVPEEDAVELDHVDIIAQERNDDSFADEATPHRLGDLIIDARDGSCKSDMTDNHGYMRPRDAGYPVLQFSV